MKKIWLVFAVLAAVCAIVASLLLIRHFSMKAPDREVFVEGDFEYTVLDDGKIEIYAYRGDATELTIPTLINGRAVVSIGEFSFSETLVAKVYFGEFITQVKGYAFAECKNLGLPSVE